MQTNSEQPELPAGDNGIGTGNPFVEAPRRYIATAQSGQWVWHIFERE